MPLRGVSQMLKTITSRDNKVIKNIRAAEKKKGRAKTGLYLAEGKRLVGEAIRDVFDSVESVLASESFLEKNKDFINSLDKSGKIVYITNDRLFDETALTETPQGLAALVKIPEYNIPNLDEMSYILILDGISEPGNMGTIIRTAEAAGIDCIMLSRGCTDIYAPKVVRSSMGSLFRMKFCSFEYSDTDKLKAKGFTVAATALHNSVSVDDANVSGKRAIIIGSEANGVSDELINASDLCIRIDMCGKVESLNAAVAAGIAMYMFKAD